MRSATCILGCAMFGSSLSAGPMYNYDQEPLALSGALETSVSSRLTSLQAHVLLTAEPEILFIDVRDPVEVSLYGRPVPIDAVVPIRVQGNEFDSDLLEWKLVDNPRFLEMIEVVLENNNLTRNDRIVITCGSGRRAEIAAHALMAAGYTQVQYIPDGYPGDEKEGFNTDNAWKIAGLPWSYDPVFGVERVGVIQRLVETAPNIETR